jgi:dTDP-glucose 4,6-dehydratase
MILVTGAAGFIGSNFVLDWLAQSDEPVINLDALTYAGNLENLASLSGDARHMFRQGRHRRFRAVARLLAEHQPRAVVNFAAESHVDRSIHGPEDFIQTNIVGTFRLLEAVRAYWNGSPEEAKNNFRFLHVSTDEVYGSLAKDDPPFARNQPLRTEQPVLGQQGRQRPPGARLPPHLRPAGADHQLLQQLRPLPLPGKAHSAVHPQRAGRQAAAHLRRRPADPRLALRQGPLQRHPPRPRSGQGGRGLQRRRLERKAQPRRRPYPVRHPRRTQPARRWQALQGPDHLRQDRPGHDRRYAIDAGKIERELGWKPAETFETGIRKTVQWYLDNQAWVANVTSGAYKNWVGKQYGA